MKPSPIVEIIWDDAGSYDGWTPNVIEPVRIRTVGLLVKRSKRAVVVALGDSEGNGAGRWRGQMVIPRGCIRSMRKLP